jgi:hypothetical protein
MRKWCCVLLITVLLTGCGSTKTFETVSDELLQPVMGQQEQIVLSVPNSASTEVMEAEDGGKLYLCDGYTMAVQTLDGGDMDRTVRTLCGYPSETLTLLQTRDGAWSRYEWVWVSAGEGGEQLGRAAVLDDGQYHYCVSVMSEASDASALEPEWDAVFASFSIG